ncbi:MAG TPA: nucleotide-binding protein [Methanocorpusculum sp.]|nr:nucleotide-binding protein [Methanocorpusculum sp.]
MNVVLDTNALMMPAQFGVDLFGCLTELLGSYNALVPPEVVAELRGLSIGKGENQAAARFGLIVADRCELLPEWGEDIPVDDKVVKNAREFNAVVVTNDKKLRKKLLDERIPVVILRSRCKLDLIGK